MAGEEFHDANGANAESVPLREYYRIVLSRRWALAGTFTIIIVLVALWTFAQTPVYRATSLLLIEPRRPNVANVQDVYDPITAGVSILDYYKTQFEILKSRRIAEPVADALKLAERPEFRGMRDPVGAFVKTIVIEPVRESRLVRVSVDSTDKAFATRAANAIVQQFVDENNQRAFGVSDSGLKKLRDMERSLRPKHEAAARALQQFKEEHNIPIDESQSIAVQQLKLLAEELSRARAERAKAAAEHRTVVEALKGGVAPATLPGVAQSTLINELRMSLAKLEEDREDLLRRYKPDHPQVRAIDARVQSVRGRLAAEEQAIVATAENRLAAARGEEEELARAVTAAQELVSELGRKGIRLQMLREEAETIATSYKNIARRIEEVEVAIATGDKSNNMFVIDAALEPLAPVKPQKGLNLLLGGLFGAVSGIGLCFLLEYLDNTVKGKEEIERLLGYPVLGFVPRVSIARGEGNGHGAPAAELAALREPRAPVAESFRTIRTGLGFTLPAGVPTAIVVTSASSGEGKTFTSVNLAFALAQTGKRVLLVDADLRRPRMHDVFDIEPGETGLSTTIAGGREPTLEAVRKTSVATLDVLPAGPIPPNPAELLGTEAMKVFLDRALAAYDWVVLDAPPITLVTDAAILLGYAPHAVFVVRAFATVKHAAQRAREILDQAPGRVAGVVLNTIDVPSGHEELYYGGYYAYRYSYGTYGDGGNGEKRQAKRRKGVEVTAHEQQRT